MFIKLLVTAIIGIVCSILGAYAGKEGTSKLWRRLGIPIFLTITAYLVLHNLWVLTLLLLYIPLSQGYGVPCWNDEGSMLGGFWYDLIKKYNKTYTELKVQELASILTRGTIGLLICLLSIAIPILRGNWIVYLFTTIGTVLVYTCISWRDFGTIKGYTYSELYTYLGIGIKIIIDLLF